MKISLESCLPRSKRQRKTSNGDRGGRGSCSGSVTEAGELSRAHWRPAERQQVGEAAVPAC